MIFVDAATGSNDLVRPLSKLGLPVQKTHLDSGDLVFEGLGEGGHPTMIGVEYKKLGELIQSLRSARLQGHQLPKMLLAFDHRWLVVEGTWRHDDAGTILTYQGRRKGWAPIPGKMSAGELEKQLLTLEMLGGLHVRYTNTRRDSIRFFASLYHWWTDTALDKHTSHLAVYHPAPLVPISWFRSAVTTFPGIGLKTSLAVEDFFDGNLLAACSAPAEVWAAITTTDDRGHTRRLGEKDATRIVAACRGTLHKRRKRP